MGHEVKAALGIEPQLVVSQAHAAGQAVVIHGVSRALDAPLRSSSAYCVGHLTPGAETCRRIAPNSRNTPSRSPSHRRCPTKIGPGGPFSWADTAPTFVPSVHHGDVDRHDAATFASPGPESDSTTWRLLATSMRISTARPLTSGSFPHDHSASAAANLTRRSGPRVEGQATDAPIGLEDQHRFVRMDRKLQAEARSVSFPWTMTSPSSTDGGNPRRWNLRAEHCGAAAPASGRAPLRAGERSDPMPCRTQGMVDHITDHRQLRRLGDVDEVTKDVPDPPAGAPGW